MDKKIASIAIILLILISATIAFISFKQSETVEDNQTYSGEDVTKEDISNEIDETFLSEEDEVEIGDMI